MTPSHPSRRGQAQPALAAVLGVVAVVGIVAAVLVSRPNPATGPGASDRPSLAPSASPTATPATTPPPASSADPTVEPTATPSSGLGTIELRNATRHEVRLQVHDQTGDLEQAVSGTPGDGMSAQWHKAIVRNGDVDTILITWAGLPQDDTLDLGVALIDGEYVVTIVQAGPVPNSDAMGEDRIVALTFDRSVAAEDVTVQVLDRTVD